MDTIRSNVSLATFTTLDIGGPAEFFTEATSIENVKGALRFAKEKNLPVTFLGGGSDVLIADEGIAGLVVRMCLQGLSIRENVVTVAAGERLDAVVKRTIVKGLGGLETLVGIPGTIGGAVFGNAGAYGRAVSDFLSGVTVWNGASLKTLHRDECAFTYRASIFRKHPEWAIAEATFSLTPVHRRMLEGVSAAVLAHRAVRYPSHWKFPGSFFKNVDVAAVPPDALAKIPRYGVMGNKIQAGFLLELAGAIGARKGNVRVADHHANLFINEGGATAEELVSFAKEYWRKVYEEFGVILEPEVHLFGFKANPFALV